jgi:hypothetical protein
MLPWWEISPERLEWEYEWLRHLGFKFQELRKDSDSGTLELLVHFPIDERTLSLRVVFPPFYPITRFEVFTDDLNLEHHQHPYSKVLCLLGRPTSLWNPSDSLASFLRERMPLVIEAGKTEDIEIAGRLEELQAEPGSTYFPYDPHSTVMVTRTLNIGTGLSGRFRAKIARGQHENKPIIRGVITDVDGHKAEGIPDNTQAGLGFNRQIEGRWFRLSRYTQGLSAIDFLEQASKENAAISKPNQFEIGPPRLELLAFLIPDEHGHRVLGESWIFVLRVTTPVGGARGRPKIAASYIRASVVGISEMQKRIPELSGMSGRTLVVVGLGCLGAPSVIEFAKAGIGELRILDDDVVEPGTTVRWPLGLSIVGESKVDALMQFIWNNYPTTKIKGMIARAGALDGTGGLTLSQYRSFFEGADLIFDATAEVGVSSLLSRISMELRIPLVVVSATPGGWGGVVVASQPPESGCYDCFLRSVNDKSVPLPPASLENQISIEGCANPTFTAANFDTAEIALAGVRAAVAALSPGKGGAYPKMDGKIGIVSLRGTAGQAIFPEWKTYALDLHPECPWHK